MFIRLPFLIETDFKQWQHRFQGFLRLTLSAENAEVVLLELQAVQISCRLYRAASVKIPQYTMIRNFELQKNLFTKQKLSLKYYDFSNHAHKIVRLDNYAIASCALVEREEEYQQATNSLETLNNVDNLPFRHIFYGGGRASAVFSTSGVLKSHRKKTIKLIDLQFDLYFPRQNLYLRLSKSRLFSQSQISLQEKQKMMWKAVVDTLAMFPQNLLFMSQSLTDAIKNNDNKTGLPKVQKEDNYLEEFEWTILNASDRF